MFTEHVKEPSQCVCRCVFPSNNKIESNISQILNKLIQQKRKFLPVTANFTHLKLFIFHLLPFASNQFKNEIINDFDVFLKRGFQSNINKTLYSPEYINISPVHDEIGVIKGFAETISKLI